MTTLRRAFLLAFGVEVPLAILLIVWGIPSPVSQDVIGNVIELTHLPGILLLERLGLCCGFANSRVISDVWTGAVQHPNATGITSLAGANLIVSTGLAFLVLLLSRTLRRHGEAAAA